MTIDNSIREQGYIYFLSEAPDLLQTLEAELFNLAEERTTATIHNLMRATHTIKGGAANVGLEVIQQISHSLEDVFKALYNPDVVIDAELQTLLFNSYECLYLALNYELNSTSYNSEDLLNRASAVFNQLQEKLGDAFTTETYIPTSEELGFDIVLSIFETGVTQSIEKIADIINDPPALPELVEFIASQAEVFVGLAESLNLPGFGDIGKTIMAALEINPDQAIQIAEISLVDLEQAKAAIIAGDRTQGGEPSLALKQLANQINQESPISPDETEESAPLTDFSDVFNSEIKQFYTFLQNDYQLKNRPLKLTVIKFYIKIICYIFGWFNHVRLISKKELNLTLLAPHIDDEQSLSYVDSWLSDFFLFLQELEDSQSLCVCRQGVILTIIIAVIQFLYAEEGDAYLIPFIQQKISDLAAEYKQLPPINQKEQDWFKRDNLKQLIILKDIPANTYKPPHDTLVESIWGDTDVISNEPEGITPQIELTRENDGSANHELSVSLPISENLNSDSYISQSIPEELVLHPPRIPTELVDSVDVVPEEKEQISPTKNSRQPAFVRVEIEGLQHLNYLAGELLIYHKRQGLEEERLQVIIDRLSQQLARHQNTLNQLRDLPLQTQNFASPTMQQLLSVNFDALEMDEYTDFHLALHEASEENLQLQETLESLDILFKQSHQLQEKNQSLVLGILENVDNARMLPLENVLNRFPQMLQKLAHIYGKQVAFKLNGTKVLIDKAIAEKLYDPLLHLIRNAFDHGIESPEVRRHHGKSEQGTIEIRAYHQASQTIIEVQDDGQGLNFERIRAKAIDLNLISANHTPTSDELLEVLFSPGFSTAGKVSEISGRGMGLDIVRSHLQGLEGSISVNSLPNQGTTFILKIPFSMTTDKLMIVQAGGAVYALLLDSIEKIVLPFTEQVKCVDGKKVLYWNTEEDERMLNIRPLSDLMFYSGSLVSGANAYNLNNNAGEMRNPVLVLRRNQEILAMEVDQIIGEQELVIRPLGNAIAPPKYVYGCSSLANGNLILVIDGTLLVESKESQSAPIDLKAIAPAANFVPDPAQFRKSANITSQKPQIILVVDDAISLRQTLSLTLQKYGYQVIQAENGADALEKLQTHPEVKMVISDLEMPNMNGFQLLSHLRQENDTNKLPVIILTSRSADKHRQLAEGLGATAYFSKPFLEDEFIATIKNVLSKDVENSSQLALSH